MGSVNIKEFWIWDYLAESRWHRSTVFIDEDGYSTDGNHYPVIHGAKFKIKVESSKLVLGNEDFAALVKKAPNKTAAL